MTWSAICFFDASGNSLIRHKYRNDITNKDCDSIINHICLERSGDDEPITYCCDASTIYIQKNGIFLSLSSKKDSNCLTGFAFLSNIHQLITSYIVDFNPSEIKENSILIREILEEAMDFGYPQITDAKIMKQYITGSMKSVPSYRAPGPPAAVTNAVSFRPDNLQYLRNEVFIDVVEELNYKMNSNGNVIQSEIIGSVILRVYLTGMPELKLTVKNNLPLIKSNQLENPSGNHIDIKFHQCVSQKGHGGRNCITFVPPDGKFALLNYRMKCDLEPMFITQLNILSTNPMTISYDLTVRTSFPENLTADFVKLLIPVAADLDSPKFSTTSGKAKYHPENDSVHWEMTKVKSGSIFRMNVVFKKPSESIAESQNQLGAEPLGDRTSPIEIKFSIPFISLSGMQILSLDIFERSQYPSEKFVSYVSRNGKVFQY